MESDRRGVTSAQRPSSRAARARVARAASRSSRSCVARSSPGRYEPGERLIEATLSSELGTSRGPVREALRQLENEGLVMSFPYRGAVVLGVSDEEVQEVLIPIRLTLERYSFVHALDRMTDDGLRRARQAGVADGAGGAGERPAQARRGRPPLPRHRHLELRADRTPSRSGARSGRGSAPTSSATAAARASARWWRSTASCSPRCSRATRS